MPKMKRVGRPLPNRHGPARPGHDDVTRPPRLGAVIFARCLRMDWDFVLGVAIEISSFVCNLHTFKAAFSNAWC